MQELELIPLCRAFIRVRETIVLENTPTGNFMIGELVDSHWEGERFSARQRGQAAADWLQMAPDGTARADVRITLETDQNELIFVEYSGRVDLETGFAYTTPTFRTGAPNLQWMNRIQAVAKGHFDAEAMTVTYPQVYEMR
jgi:hypothetical protein